LFQFRHGPIVENGQTKLHEKYILRKFNINNGIRKYKIAKNC